MSMEQCPKTADQTMALPSQSLGYQYAAAAALQVGQHCGRCDEPRDPNEGWVADHGGAVAAPGRSWAHTSDEVDRTSAAAVAAAGGSTAAAVVAFASACAVLPVALA